MLRLIGAMLISVGSLGLGLWYRRQFMARIQTLRQLQNILELIMSEIRYGRATLPECCRKIARQTKEPFRSCFQDIFDRMNQNAGESFQAVFREEMGRCLQTLNVKKEDCIHFLSFLEEGSYAEGRMQLDTLERSKELLLKTLTYLEKENDEKCRMAVGLGAMLGLFLLLVLL